MVLPAKIKKIVVRLDPDVLSSVTRERLEDWLAAHDWIRSYWVGRPASESNGWWERPKIENCRAYIHISSVQATIQAILDEPKPNRKATQAILDSLDDSTYGVERETDE